MASSKTIVKISTNSAAHNELTFPSPYIRNPSGTPGQVNHVGLLWSQFTRVIVFTGSTDWFTERRINHWLYALLRLTQTNNNYRTTHTQYCQGGRNSLTLNEIANFFNCQMTLHILLIYLLIYYSCYSSFIYLDSFISFYLVSYHLSICTDQSDIDSKHIDPQTTLQICIGYSL